MTQQQPSKPKLTVMKTVQANLSNRQQMANLAKKVMTTVMPIRVKKS